VLRGPAAKGCSRRVANGCWLPWISEWNTRETLIVWTGEERERRGGTEEGGQGGERARGGRGGQRMGGRCCRSATRTAVLGQKQARRRPRWRPRQSPVSLRPHHRPFSCLCHHSPDRLLPAPLPSPLCGSALCCLFFLNASLSILRQAAPFPFLPYLSPPSLHPPSLRHIQLCIFLRYFWLHTSGGSSADLSTVQLICLRTPTLSALAFGRYYFFWTLTQHCSYTSISPFVLLNLLAGPEAGGDADAPATSSPGPSQLA